VTCLSDLKYLSLVIAKSLKMKRKLPIVIFTALFFGTLLFMACSKSEGSGNAPAYASEETTTGANPHASTAGSQTSTT
jgi:hypothetical protein